MNPLELVFIKLHNGDDIVGYLLDKTDPHTHHHIGRPLHIHIETDMSNGRQMIEVEPMLPPILIELDRISIPVDDVNIMTPIRDSFREELDDVIKYFYSVKPIARKPVTKNDNNIVPFIGKDSSKIH